ncbi:DNA repair and recombination protein RadB [Candidatus Woesearchaeota archaeon]|jgi:DNA repair protein RadB|nr:DNA repair and recombination protein RadB [Candidatus Woesearchaeota archaeon]MBT4595426.1 DNA repair and recombination protein RadB [Candidatus Woesearchaeota archaeon]MBT5741141.1 DNA repair and recombination protein RadB [Candidatus Woesearchaeota archaeon]MBT7849692.1 DNA repair and recombination protein RadB [Candidatus Woesearchaeota archaeon]MBT7962505.1 DNA repair and recombination protein RadB [Candidatus Woesearchaeota archaeon]
MELIDLKNLKQEKLNTGNILLNNFLGGGIEKDIITTFYGPSGSGKTNFCLMLLNQVINNGQKVIYVDTEGGLSLERLKQINSENYETILSNTYLFKPTSFNMQNNVFSNINDMISKLKEKNIGIILVDSIVYLYRLEMAKNKNIPLINQMLAKQIGILTDIARILNIPVVLTNQVYANFEKKETVNMVGGDILKYTSKALMELKIVKPIDDYEHLNRIRKVSIIKNRFIPEGKSEYFEICNKGIKEIDSSSLEYYDIKRKISKSDFY